MCNLSLHQANVIVIEKNERFQFPMLEFLGEHRNPNEGVIHKAGVW